MHLIDCKTKKNDFFVYFESGFFPCPFEAFIGIVATQKWLSQVAYILIFVPQVAVLLPLSQSAGKTLMPPMGAAGRCSCRPVASWILVRVSIAFSAMVLAVRVKLHIRQQKVGDPFLEGRVLDPVLP